MIGLVSKGCLFLFNYFIDMRPTLMSPFFVKTCFFDKKWTHQRWAHVNKIINKERQPLVHI